MKVSNITVKVSKRPVRGSYSALVSPDNGDLGPVGEDNVIDFTAWFQNPEGTSNQADPITVPFNESITAQGVPSDITAVKVYWRRDGGQSHFLVDLTDVGAGNWAYVDYDAIPLNNPPHIGPPWEDIEFTAKYISPSGVAWQDWVYANVSHVAPPPEWDDIDLPDGPPWTGPQGGKISDCLTAWDADGVACYVEDLDIDPASVVSIGVDLQPPEGTTWNDWVGNIFGFTSLVAGDLTAGVTVDQFGAGGNSGQWDFNGVRIKEGKDTFLTSRFPSLNHRRRMQWRVELAYDTLTIQYRYPDVNAEQHLPLWDWNEWEDSSSTTDAWSDDIWGCPVGRAIFGGSYRITGISDGSLPGGGVGVQAINPQWAGAIFGYYLEVDDEPIAAVNDFAEIALGTPEAYSNAWDGDGYRIPYYDMLNNLSWIAIQNGDANTICFTIEY